MKLLIIGYKNHALRLHRLLTTLGANDIKLWNYRVDSYDEILNSDVIFIASPNNTHVDYIKNILETSKKKDSVYIFCEKPPATEHESIMYLDHDIPENIKKRIYFNFNYRHSILAKGISKVLNSGELGNPIYFSFYNSHGLAFKDPNNWRFSSGNLMDGILGTVTSHYLDLCLWLFDIHDIFLYKNDIAKNNIIDTITVNLLIKHKKYCNIDIFNSYAGPYINEAKLIFEDGYFSLKNGKLSLFSPRDSFSSDGRFTIPNETIIFDGDYYDVSLLNSLKYFIDAVKMNREFPLKMYNCSMRTNKFLLDYC